MGAKKISLVFFIFIPFCVALSENTTVNSTPEISELEDNITTTAWEISENEPFIFNITVTNNLTTTVAPDDLEPSFGTTESAIILAGVFVVFAFAGYAAMLFWRRYLQVRYGDSDVLVTDDVYDITDLRNFEI